MKEKANYPKNNNNKKKKKIEFFLAFLAEGKNHMTVFISDGIHLVITVHCHVSGPPKRHCYVYFAALDLIWKCNYVIVLKFCPLRSVYVNFNSIGKLFYK